MRTNIEIDDALMAEAMAASRSATKREAVERGLRMLVQMARQQGIRQLRGRIDWDGDLEAGRLD